MQRALTALLVLGSLVAGCNNDEAAENSAEPQDDAGVVAVTYAVKRDLDGFITLLWQRTNPEEYKELLSRTQLGNIDPFAAEVADVPKEQLNPGTFGLKGWARGIVPAVFRYIDHPLNETPHASAEIDIESLEFRVTHTTKAIKTLEDLLPELLEWKETDR